jgi:hypothetical protein
VCALRKCGIACAHSPALYLHTYAPPSLSANLGDNTLRMRQDSGWEIRFATPAYFPHQTCSPYRGLHVRRESVGFVPRSRTIFCRPARTLMLRFATFSTLSAASLAEAHGASVTQNSKTSSLRDRRNSSTIGVQQGFQSAPLKPQVRTFSARLRTPASRGANWATGPLAAADARTRARVRRAT